MRIKTLLRTVISPVLGCTGGADCLLRGPCPESSCTENDLCADCRVHLERHVDNLITEAAYSDDATLAAAIAAAVHERGIVEDEVIGTMRDRRNRVRVQHGQSPWFRETGPTPHREPCPWGANCFRNPAGQVI